MPHTVWALLLVGLWPFAPVLAQSNIAAAHAFAWGANVGGLDWRNDSEHGVELGQFVGSGYIYSANLGWIDLGSGSPADGIHYRNASASDFGVNLDAAGNLRGFAYGANIGWINFHESGAPRLDRNTGKLAGFAYGANIGWINLGDATFFLAIDRLVQEADKDSDQLPDAWELSYIGDLTTLSATGDFDHDGQTDLREYLDDTDPGDALDFLDILNSIVSDDRSSIAITWATKPTRQYRIEIRTDFSQDHPWVDAGLGLQTSAEPTTTRVVPMAGAHAFFRIHAVRPLQP